MAVARTPAGMKQFYKASRFLHTYISSALFALLLMFCVSGFFLNHSDWFADKAPVQRQQRDMPAELLTAMAPDHSRPENWNPDLPQIKHYLSQHFGIGQPDSVNLDNAAAEITLEYPLAAGYATVFLNAKDRQLTLEYEAVSVVSTLNNLHMGRHTGAGWSWVIDLAAVLMTFFALTGMIILWQNRRNRVWGLWCAGLGVITPAAVYLLFVPHL